MMRFAPLLLVLATPAQAERGPKPDPCAPRGQVFVSPAGEPFRAAPGAPAPVALWFAGADRDGDGRITLPEMRADAARFFAMIDSDHDGEIVPDELARYEREVAPEIGIYDPTPPGRLSKRDRLYGAPLGAGRYGLLNIPDPVAAADADFNRGTTRIELVVAAARAFMVLAKGQDALRLADLPPTPQAAIIADCAAQAARKRR